MAFISKDFTKSLFSKITKSVIITNLSIFLTKNNTRFFCLQKGILSSLFLLLYVHPNYPFPQAQFKINLYLLYFSSMITQNQDNYNKAMGHPCTPATSLSLAPFSQGINLPSPLRPQIDVNSLSFSSYSNVPTLFLPFIYVWE